MRRIVHLSDLHFGTVPEGLAEALARKVAELAPDLVAVSGDLTQRARDSQFAEAAAFLARLPAPVLAVPGNHDVPLDNLYSRLLRPFARWRRHIGPELEPVWEDDLLNVVGVNTVNPLVWQAGRISPHAVRRVCDLFGAGPHRRLRVAVLHHPLTQAPGVPKAPMRGAEAAIRALADCGADVVLSGHLHSWGAMPFAAGANGRSALLVQAGTALSSRQRGQVNDFNLLTLEGDRLTVQRQAVDAGGRFAPAETSTFRRSPRGWLPDVAPA